MPDEDTTADLESLKPANGAARHLRERLTLRGEFLLALLPTAIILGVLLCLELVTDRLLLYASLASSAFLIYLDPQHGANSIRSLLLSQLLAAGLGFGAHAVFGPSHPYAAAGCAMVGTITLMIALDAVHPPAVATSLAFAYNPGEGESLMLFGFAALFTALLVVIQRWAVWILARSRAMTAKRAR